MKFYKNPKIVQLTPVATTILLEMSTLSHVATMWMKRTSEGQSIVGALLVILALVLWHNWYLCFTPEQKFAIWSTRVGILTNVVAYSSVLIFR